MVSIENMAEHQCSLFNLKDYLTTVDQAFLFARMSVCLTEGYACWCPPGYAAIAIVVGEELASAETEVETGAFVSFPCLYFSGYNSLPDVVKGELKAWYDRAISKRLVVFQPILVKLAGWVTEWAPSVSLQNID